MVKSRKNPGVAAVLSFLFPGAGQIYNEQIWQGLALICLMFISLGLIAIGIGLILFPIIWIIGIYDALSQARKINDEIDKIGSVASSGDTSPPSLSTSAKNL